MITSLSFGGGVNTTALIILIAAGQWPKPDVSLFADTGDEHDETYAYMKDVSVPYAREHGINVVTLGNDWRSKTYKMSLEKYCLEHKMVPGTWVRWCTHKFKILPIQRYLKATYGASKKSPVETWIGIATEEKRRAVPAIWPGEIKRYPLIELGVSRMRCEQLIADAGLPPAPKSGCWYCPFQKQSRWHQLKRERPDLFARALKMERNTNGTYLPMFGSLERIAMQEELPGFDEAIEAEAGCVTGYCFV